MGRSRSVHWNSRARVVRSPPEDRSSPAKQEAPRKCSSVSGERHFFRMAGVTSFSSAFSDHMFWQLVM